MKKKPFLGLIRFAVKPALLMCFLPVIPAMVTTWVQGGLPDISPVLEVPLASPGHIGIREAMGLAVDQVLWIDARQEDRFDKHAIPGVQAVWCSENDWGQGLDNLLSVWDGDQVLIVFCDGKDCDASDSVAHRLREELGLNERQVRVLSGGWDAYLAWESDHGR